MSLGVTRNETSCTHAEIYFCPINFILVESYVRARAFSKRSMLCVPRIMRIFASIYLNRDDMKYGVSRKTLLAMAGTIWLVAGINVLRIGLTGWASDTHAWQWKAVGAAGVFMFFFGFIFPKVYRKHTLRIAQGPVLNHPFAFFDAKGWVLMGIMIALGVVMRRTQVLPLVFISMFYVGLGTALTGTGIRFLRYGWRHRQRLR